MTLFANEKLVAPEISLGGNFSLDKNGEFYSTTKIYGYIKNDNVNESYKFWLGLLNSRLFWFFIKQTGYILRGGYYTFKTNYIFPFPIPKDISLHVVKSVEELVDEILILKEKYPSDNISLWENKIDNIIYNLYELSLEEIKVINEHASY